MAESKPKTAKGNNAGDSQASKPKKLLKGGHDPTVIGKETQWKPGQSGNPTGNKPGYKHINTWIQEIVTDEDFKAKIVDPDKGFIEFKGAPLPAILKSLSHIALTHPDFEVRLKAMEKIFKYGWPTKNEHTGEDGAPLTLPVVRIIDERQHDKPSA